MGTRILAIVVTYFPERDLLNKNISAFINDVDKVLIWENTPESQKYQYRHIDYPKIEYCGDGINSISHALNYAWKYAESNGYDYLLTMDQDSVWVNFNGFLQKTVRDANSLKGIWGPAIVTNDNGSSLENNIIETDITITSGMLLHIDLINKIKGWNERFCIDCVDNEFCLKAKLMGVSIYQFRFSCTYLMQRYGHPRIVHIGKYYATLREDSYSRLYSIYKSHIMLFRLFPEFKKYRSDFKLHWVKKIKWVMIYEKDRFRKLAAIVKGIIEGLNCELEEYSQYTDKKKERWVDKIAICKDLFWGR